MLKLWLHEKRKELIHLAVVAYVVLLSAALATAQQNPQTDSPSPTPAPRPSSGKNQAWVTDGLPVYQLSELETGLDIIPILDTCFPRHVSGMIACRADSGDGGKALMLLDCSVGLGEDCKRKYLLFLDDSKPWHTQKKYDAHATSLNFEVPGTINPTVVGGVPPKEKAQAPEYEAMALSMAKSIGFQEIDCNTGGVIQLPSGLDPSKNYVFNNLRIEDLKCLSLVQVTCPNFENARSKIPVKCQAWNDLGSGKVLNLECYPDGCLVQGVIEVPK